MCVSIVRPINDAHAQAITLLFIISGFLTHNLIFTLRPPPLARSGTNPSARHPNPIARHPIPSTIYPHTNSHSSNRHQLCIYSPHPRKFPSKDICVSWWHRAMNRRKGFVLCLITVGVNRSASTEVVLHRLGHSLGHLSQLSVVESSRVEVSFAISPHESVQHRNRNLYISSRVDSIAFSECVIRAAVPGSAGPPPSEDADVVLI